VADDVRAIVGLLADDPLGAARETDPADSRYRAAFAEIDGDPQQLLTVLVRGAVVIGTMQLTVLPGLSHRGARQVLIEGVRVSAAERGSGLGGRYVGWAIGWAGSVGAGIVQLTSNASRTDARRFYERLGFRATHVGMKLTLA
jgi:GNAT superfamily N-acetyltransferase